jgi:DnaJ-class molecular chaperone
MAKPNKQRGGGHSPNTQGRTEDKGTMTCGACQGTGETEDPKLEADGDGGFSGATRSECTVCGGTGKISK